MEWLSIQLTDLALKQTRSLAAAAALSYVRTARSTVCSSPQQDKEELEAEERVRVLAAEAEKVRRQHQFDAELQRRKMALFYYLLRSPLFDR